MQTKQKEVGKMNKALRSVKSAVKDVFDSYRQALGQCQEGSCSKYDCGDCEVTGFRCDRNGAALRLYLGPCEAKFGEDAK